MPAVREAKKVTPSAGTISTWSAAAASAGLAASVTTNTWAPLLFASFAARTVLSYRRQKLIATRTSSAENVAMVLARSALPLTARTS
jgi:hypothetical protein